MTAESRLASQHGTGRQHGANVAKTSLTRKVLLVDVGGTSVKVLTTDEHGIVPIGVDADPQVDGVRSQEARPGLDV